MHLRIKGLQEKIDSLRVKYNCNIKELIEISDLRLIFFWIAVACLVLLWIEKLTF